MSGEILGDGEVLGQQLGVAGGDEDSDGFGVEDLLGFGFGGGGEGFFTGFLLGDALGFVIITAGGVVFFAAGDLDGLGFGFGVVVGATVVTGPSGPETNLLSPLHFPSVTKLSPSGRTFLPVTESCEHNGVSKRARAFAAALIHAS